MAIIPLSSLELRLHGHWNCTCMVMVVMVVMGMQGLLNFTPDCGIIQHIPSDAW